MNYVLTLDALADLEEIGTFLAEEYPAIAPAVEMEFRRIFALVVEFPKLGRPTPREGVHEVAVGRYPY